MPFSGSEVGRKRTIPIAYDDNRLASYCDSEPFTYDSNGNCCFDPTICRWMIIDPLAEKYYSLAPYVYCHNTPIVFIDPNGCADINWKLVFINSKAKEFYEISIFDDNKEQRTEEQKQH